MIWKNYSHLEGHHAFLSPSKHYWLNHSREKLINTYLNHKKISLGTQYHALAARLIKLAVRLPNTEASFNGFVNDAIGFKMAPEVILYHSPHCYGTADAISFTDGMLRVHDLKTGVSSGSINQLLIYAALFCLDYSLDIRELKEIHLRIYHNGEIIEFLPSPEAVFDIASKIVEAEKIIESINIDAVL